MTWLYFALLAMIGETVWLLIPKVFPVTNPFSVLLYSGLTMIPVGLIGSKITYKTWITPTSLKAGIAEGLMASVIIVSYIIAVNYGGKIGVLGVIVRSGIIISALVAYLFWHEKLSSIQILGMILALIGISLMAWSDQTA